MGAIRVSRLYRRLAVLLAILVLLITIFFIIDMQSNFNITSGHLKYVTNFYKKRPKIMDSEHLGYNYTNIYVHHDKFEDLMALLFTPRNPNVAAAYKRVIIETPFGNNPTYAEVMEVTARNNATDMELFLLGIGQQDMYREDDPIVDKVLYEMATMPIVGAEQKADGVQIKLVITYPRRVKSLFKPMRCPREQESLPNHTYYSDLERHNAEIASFHLDRALGFRRSAPITGRVINVTSDVYDLADDDLLKTFFKSPTNQTCFYGQCRLYCDVANAICGTPENLEGSFSVYLPLFDNREIKVWAHPWKRTYRVGKAADWETDPYYCEKVKNETGYHKSRRLVDLTDMAIMDFLSGNWDRHNFETIRIFGDDTYLVHFDYGRAFGRAYADDLLILAPLLQCCVIRASTLENLLKHHIGPKHLSDVMRESMINDPIAPVLWEPHLHALDRRVQIILEAIRDCIKKAGESDVIGFSYSSSE